MEILDTITAWSESVKLSFSAEETKAMLLTGRFKGRNGHYPTVALNGRHVGFVGTYKYLGVILGQQVDLHCSCEVYLQKSFGTLSETEESVIEQSGIGYSDSPLSVWESLSPL